MRQQEEGADINIVVDPHGSIPLPTVGRASQSDRICGVFKYSHCHSSRQCQRAESVSFYYWSESAIDGFLRRYDMGFGDTQEGNLPVSVNSRNGIDKLTPSRGLVPTE